MRFLCRRRGVVVVVRSVLDVPQHSVLLLLVTVQHAWLGRFVAAHVTRVPDHFVLRPFVLIQIGCRSCNYTSCIETILCFSTYILGMDAN